MSRSDLSTAIVLRHHVPEDLDWVIAEHGRIYASEYGWDASFEALVADIAGAFADNHDPSREAAFLAVRGDERLGCAFVVAQSTEIAKLRLVLVHETARGLGLGGRLLDRCIAFARDAGYRSMTLWTNDVLSAARALYVSRGFERVSHERHHSFGHDLVGEHWTRALE